MATSVIRPPQRPFASRNADVVDLLQQAQDCIEHSMLPRAVDKVSMILQDIQDYRDIEALFELLLVLIPACNEEGFKTLISNLQNLLDVSGHLPAQQGKLALILAERYISHAQQFPSEAWDDCLNAMSYYAIAIQIADMQGDRELSHSIHLLASELFIQVFSHEIKTRLKDNKGKPEVLERLISSLSLLERFCSNEEHLQLIQEIYEEAGSIVAKIPPASQAAYLPCRQLLRIGVQCFALSQKNRTEVYKEQLECFRNGFKGLISQNMRDSQRCLLQSTRDFFNVFLEDIFIILGPPPCGYDIRAMGSLGREEPCPYSDLEFLILIEKEEHKSYFQKLVQLLQFQIISLGESARGDLAFTCLRKTNLSGFHIDTGANPLNRPGLLGIPKKIAQQQNTDPSKVEAATIENTLLRSATLSCNQPALFEEYQACLNLILDASKRRQTRALSLMRERSSEYQKLWPTSRLPNTVHIKNQFVQLLNFFFADLALYYGIQATNTLDIIDVLVEKQAFSEKTGCLLKEAISAIYCLRIRLHQFYGEQKEEGYLESLSGCILKESEKSQLDTIYWLILRPLYQSCLVSVLDMKKPLEEVFRNLNLISVSLDEIFSSQEDPTFFLPLVRTVATYLVNTDAVFATHVHIFKKLSARSHLEPLRKAYLEVLENSRLPDVELDQIRDISNRAGLRLSFARKEKQLQAQIEAISSLHPHGEQVPQVKMISSQGERYLNPEIVREILDKDGNLKNGYPGSAHCVVSAGGLHFKQKPTHPLMEFAIHTLFFRLAGDLTPTTELVRFEVDGKKMYPVLISTTVTGNTLKKRLSQPLELEGGRQWARWTWMLLCSFLVRIGDGRTSNYILDDQDNISCVDNDISFVELFTKKGFSSQVHFCCALFCLFQNRGLERGVLEEFCSLDTDAILTCWIDDVIQKEAQYLSLFSEQERSRLYQEDPNNRFKATILFKEGALATLNAQFVYLQKQLSSFLQPNDTLTPADLLKHFIDLTDGPTLSSAPGYYIARAYRKAGQSTIEDRLKCITSRSQDQSLTSLKSDQVCLGRIPTHEDVEKKKLSPVRAREELLMSVLCITSNFLSVGTEKGKDTILVNFKEIKDGNAPDLERQTLVLRSLASVQQLKPQKPLSITFQNCAVLDTKFLDHFLHENLEYLDLRYCHKIINGDVEMISRKCPKIKELYLSGCDGLTGIQEGRFFSELLTFSSLQVLFVDRCQNLEKVRLRSPYLKKVCGDKNAMLSHVELESFFRIETRFHGCLKLKKPNVSLIQQPELLKLYGSEDEAFLYAALKKNPSVFQMASESLKNDKGFIRRAIKINAGVVAHLSEKFKNDEDFILELVKLNVDVYDYLSEKQKDGRTKCDLFHVLECAGEAGFNGFHSDSDDDHGDFLANEYAEEARALRDKDYYYDPSSTSLTDKFTKLRGFVSSLG